MRKSLAKWMIAQQVERGLPLSNSLARRVAGDPDLAAFEKSLREADRRLRDELPNDVQSSPKAMRRVLAAVASASPDARAAAGRLAPARLAAAALIALAGGLAIYFAMPSNRIPHTVENHPVVAQRATPPKIDADELRRLVAAATGELADSPKPLLVEARLIVQDGKRFGAYLASGFSPPRESDSKNIQ